ncbi:MAG: DUF6580 family putative transport protein [Bacteroidota bacterium]
MSTPEASRSSPRLFTPRFGALCGLVVLAVLSRWLPHPPNFTPIAALALFGGAHFTHKGWAFAVPMVAMLLGDALIGFHSLMPVVYGAFAATVGIGLLLRRRRSPLRVAGATLAGSVLFFVVTNFGLWAIESFYPKTLEGLVACYVAALPYFYNTLLGDAFFTAVLFGGFALAEWRFPVLRPATYQLAS